MEYAPFLKELPALDLPFDDSVVTTNALRGSDGLAVFFHVQQDVELPEHAHLGQWGTVLKGRLDLTIEGKRRTIYPGESYNIPSEALHSAKAYAGSVILDFFEEPDRYPMKRPGT